MAGFSSTHNRTAQIIAFISIILAVFCIHIFAPAAVAHASSSPAKVTNVSDGDTFKVALDGRTHTVRIVGVNAPEKKECYGSEATAAMTRLVNGKRVWLERDAQQGDKDKYGRLLRFVWLDDRTSINRQLLLEGFGYEVLYSKKPHKYRASFQAAQAEAKAAKRGLWADATCAGKRTKPVQKQVATPPPPPAPAPAPEPVYAAPAPAPAQSGPYYANCTEVRAAGAAPIYPGQPGFRSSFDRDNDGIGCE
jgi:micrococcal nuclease